MSIHGEGRKNRIDGLVTVLYCQLMVKGGIEGHGDWFFMFDFLS